MSATVPTTRKMRRPEGLVSMTRLGSPARLELFPGDILGQFRIEQRLGKGGMCSVYLARHVNGGAKVAVKVPNPELARDPDVCERLMTEGRVLMKLRHPNIVTLFESATAPSGLPYLVMEYLQGQTLAAREHAEMAVQPAVHVLTQLCEALSAFHAVGGVHRDVKPDNIFLVRRLDAPMTVKLLDFGIARRRGDGQRQHATAVGAVVGTPDFMAPEQMMGEGVDERADIYAVGVIGHLVLTGSLPYANFREKMFNPPPSIRERRPDVPAALEAALKRALSPDPVHRFLSAQELREALGAVLGGRRATSPGQQMQTPPPHAAAALSSRPIVVCDQIGTTLATCNNLLVVPGGAWLCTRGAIPSNDKQVLLTLPGHEGFVPARVIDSSRFPPHVKATLPRGFLVEFARLEIGARAALVALAPK